MSRKRGALPDHVLRYFVEHGHIIGALDSHIGPASLDLTCTGRLWRLEGVMLPRPGMTVWQLRNILEATPLNNGGHLTPGVAYLAELRESLKLPEDVYGVTNPRSTCGRLDIHYQVVVDGQPRFDTIPAGFCGPLWAIIEPESFSVCVHEGTRLGQLRLFNADTRLSEMELEVEMGSSPLIWDKVGNSYSMDDLKISDKDGTCLLTLDLDSPIGWRARPHAPEVDLDATDLPIEEYFDPIEAKNGIVTFLPNRFHIFSSAQFVRVPPHLACEMRAMDERAGDFRAHYAGFIDPGWGWGEEGTGKGRPLTLEIRPMRSLFVGKGVPVAKIGFERLYDLPDVHYDVGKPSYSMQRTAQLARQFRQHRPAR